MLSKTPSKGSEHSQRSLRSRKPLRFVCGLSDNSDFVRSISTRKVRSREQQRSSDISSTNRNRSPLNSMSKLLSTRRNTVKGVQREDFQPMDLVSLRQRVNSQIYCQVHFLLFSILCHHLLPFNLFCKVIETSYHQKDIPQECRHPIEAYSKITD